MDANEGQQQVAAWSALLGAVGVLALGLPRLRDTGRGLRHPTAWVDRIGADQAAARLAVAALVLLAAWVAVGLAASALGRLPGLAGQGADRFARLVLPAALYRIAAGAAGMGLVLAPALDAHAVARPAAASVLSGTGDPAPAWPSDAPLQAPAWPADHSASADRPPATPPVARRAPAVTSVVVRPGDSLWSIAAGQLPRSAGPAAVARVWPRWYGANRAVIGADPDLLHPGEVLVRPASPLPTP